MKRYKTANRIFLASAILFGIAIGVHCFCENPLTGLFYFLAQSCLIGCFADWFAVEALFRNRLHLPLFKPLIPANREAVLRRLQETVEGKLVGKETFTDLLKNFSLIQFIEKEAEGSVKDIETDLARSGGELLLGFMENHKKDLSRWIRQGVDNVRVSLGFYLREKALEGNYTEQFLDKLLEEAQRAVKSDQMKQIITNKLEKLGENRERGFLERLVYSFAKFTNTVDYEDMAEAFLAALSERIELWRVDIHPFHKTLLKEWNAAVEAFLKTEEAEKALVGVHDQRADIVQHGDAALGQQHIAGQAYIKRVGTAQVGGQHSQIVKIFDRFQRHQLDVFQLRQVNGATVVAVGNPHIQAGALNEFVQPDDGLIDIARDAGDIITQYRAVDDDGVQSSSSFSQWEQSSNSCCQSAMRRSQYSFSSRSKRSSLKLRLCSRISSLE